MILRLSEAQKSLLIADAVRRRPLEACGLILGQDGKAEEIILLPNAAVDARSSFAIAPEDLTRSFFQAKRAKLGLIGIYHSHPFNDPIPSPTDVRNAFYPDCVHLIVGFRNNTPMMAAWEIVYGEVSRVKLIIGDQAAEADAEPLSNRGKTIILISAFCAFLFVIIVALSLLPPAPPIPGR